MAITFGHRNVEQDDGRSQVTRLHDGPARCYETMSYPWLAASSGQGPDGRVVIDASAGSTVSPPPGPRCGPRRRAGPDTQVREPFPTSLSTVRCRPSPAQGGG